MTLNRENESIRTYGYWGIIKLHDITEKGRKKNNTITDCHIPAGLLPEEPWFLSFHILVPPL